LSGGAHSQLEAPLRGHLTSCRCKLTAPFFFLGQARSSEQASALTPNAKRGKCLSDAAGELQSPPLGREWSG
jgi:hypothetical protein